MRGEAGFWDIDERYAEGCSGGPSRSSSQEDEPWQIIGKHVSESTRLARRSMRPETSGTASSTNEEMVCLASRGSTCVADWVMISIAKARFDRLDLARRVWRARLSRADPAPPPERPVAAA